MFFGITGVSHFRVLQLNHIFKWTILLLKDLESKSEEFLEHPTDDNSFQR